MPSAVWISRHYYGMDIREHGSKNAGATNMLRVLGVRAALPVFVIDFLKGFVAVNIMSLMRLDDAVTPSWLINLKIIAVLFAVAGHIFPIFASFRGGKGVTTLVGAVTGIQPSVALFCFVVWCIVFVFTHYVSLSVESYLHYGETSVSFIVFSVVVSLLLIWTHRKNIARLRAGTEPKMYLWKRREK